MRLLVIIEDELIGADERRDWALLERLVSLNGPDGLEVHVLASVNRRRSPLLMGVFANPWTRVVGRTGPDQRADEAAGYDPVDSATQRLERALVFLRQHRVAASGSVEEADGLLDAARRAVGRAGYQRVVVLGDAGGWRQRLWHRDLVSRLRRSSDVPVEGPQRYRGSL